MILNTYNTNKFSLIFDINDLKNKEIDLISLCGNPSKLSTCVYKLLENLNINTCSLSNFEIFSYDFKIFKIIFNAIPSV